MVVIASDEAPWTLFSSAALETSHPKDVSVTCSGTHIDACDVDACDVDARDVDARDT